MVLTVRHLAESARTGESQRSRASSVGERKRGNEAQSGAAPGRSGMLTGRAGAPGVQASSDRPGRTPRGSLCRDQMDPGKEYTRETRRGVHYRARFIAMT